MSDLSYSGVSHSGGPLAPRPAGQLRDGAMTARMLVMSTMERPLSRSDAGAETSGIVGVNWEQGRWVSIRETDVAKAVSWERV